MKISVVTVCYNAADTIERTMLSVLNQTYHDIEYIIIDGGSTDGTVDIIRKYADKIAYWVSEPDKGIYDAMNKGIKVATGEWINFMNAGDYYYSNEVLKNVFAISRYGDYLVGIAVYPNGRYWRPVRKDFSFKEMLPQLLAYGLPLVTEGYDDSRDFHIFTENTAFLKTNGGL